MESAFDKYSTNVNIDSAIKFENLVNVFVKFYALHKRGYQMN